MDITTLFEDVKALDSYDIEDTGSGYMAYRDMVKQNVRHQWDFGEWIRREDVVKLFEEFLIKKEGN